MRVLSILIAAWLLIGPARGFAADQPYTASVSWKADPVHPTVEYFTLNGPDGREIWHSLDFNQNAWWVSSTGLVVGLRSSGVEGMPGILTFLGSRGEIAGTVKVTGFSGGEYSESGKRFFANCQKPGLAVYDASGKELCTLPACRLFAASADGRMVATEREGVVRIFREGTMVSEWPVPGVPLQSMRFTDDGKRLSVTTGAEHATYNAANGALLSSTAGQKSELKKTSKDNTTSWPLAPIGQIHALGNGWGEYQNYSYTYPPDPTSAYLHPGIDVMALTDSGVAVYAVAHGWVKAWLTTSAQWHWRLAIADSSTGYADTCGGWLYAHIDSDRAHKNVGDEVNQGDQIGYLVVWPVPGFDHCHFARIRDAGSTWGAGGADWSFVDDPLHHLSPNVDSTYPCVQQALTSSKFAFCSNNTSSYVQSTDLQGDIDIVARVYDKYGPSIPVDTLWEHLNPFSLQYAIHRPGETGLVIQSFLFSHYLPYGDVAIMSTVFKQDPTCVTYGDYDNRDYFYIVSNTDGDTVLEVADTSGCWHTASYANGQYWVVVYAADQYGNTTADSQLVTVNNPDGVEGIPNHAVSTGASLGTFPSPTNGPVSIHYTVPAPMQVTLRVFNICGQVVRTLEQGVRSAGGHSMFWDGNIMGGSRVPNGIYVVQLDCPVGRIRGKVVVMR